MKKSILTLLTVVFTISVYGQHKLSYAQNIANVAIVSFPDTPRSNITDKGITYEVNDDGILYAASSASIKQTGLDLFYKSFEQSFYRGVLIGFAKSIHGKILYKKEIAVDGVKGIEYEGKGVFDTTTYYIFYRSFYYDKKLVSQGIWFKEPVSPNDARLNAFFSNFKFTGKTEHNSIWSDKALVIKGVTYALIIILLIILIVGLIIFIARRSSTKKIRE